VRQKLLAYGLLFATLMSAVLPQLALAEPYGAGPGYAMTLEQDLELAKERVLVAKEHPGQGSGTPYLSANGVIGATLISGAVFGGIFVTFITRAKQLEKLHKIQAVP